MNAKHKMSMRCDRAAGLIAIGKILEGGDKVGAAIGAEAVGSTR